MEAEAGVEAGAGVEAEAEVEAGAGAEAEVGAVAGAPGGRSIRRRRTRGGAGAHRCPGGQSPSTLESTRSRSR